MFRRLRHALGFGYGKRRHVARIKRRQVKQARKETRRRK